jgi:hypothetical protein
MKFRSFSYGIVAAVVVSSMVPMRVAAQFFPAAPVKSSAPRDGIHAPLPKSTVEAAMKAAEAKPTPRTADGHPDLNGYWDSAVNAITPRKSGHVDADGNVILGVVDPIPETLLPRLVDKNPPPYKPELLAKVKDLATHSIDNDPTWRCIPEGVPRLGAPQQIVQTPKLLVFFYQTEVSEAFRFVPIDGRPHRNDVDPSYEGDSVGHWDGDTLVVDVNQLTDETWLAGGSGNQYGSGYFHSDATHVIERITRKGDTLRYEVTVEDPNVFTKPWVMTPRTEMLDTDDMLYPQPVCEEKEAKHMVDRY